MYMSPYVIVARVSGHRVLGQGLRVYALWILDTNTTTAKCHRSLSFDVPKMLGFVCEDCRSCRCGMCIVEFRV